MAVATGTAILGAAAVAGGAAVYGSRKASKSADKQTAAMEKSADLAGVAANRSADLAEEQWDRYLETFAPLEDQLVKEASAPAVPVEAVMPVGFERMMATTDRDFANASATTARAMGGRYQYGGGMEQAAQGAIERGRIGAKTNIRIAKTNAENAALEEARVKTEQAKQQRFANMMNAASIGKGLPANAQAGFAGNAQTYGNMAGMHANAAANYNNTSAQSWNSFGNTAGNLTQLYMMNKMMTPQSQPVYSTSAWGR